MRRRDKEVSPGGCFAYIYRAFTLFGVTNMGALGKAPAIKTEVVSDPTVMSGDPVVKGTRILAETILGYLRADYSPRAIFEDYPSLPVDGVDAVARWAERTYGAGWKSAMPGTAIR